MGPRTRAAAALRSSTLTRAAAARAPCRAFHGACHLRTEQPPHQQAHHSHPEQWRPSSSPRCAPHSTETLILQNALRHIPDQGFTQQALVRGARDAGYPAAPAASMFPRGGPFDLVLFYLVQQRLALAERNPPPKRGGDVRARLKMLALDRLHANAPVAAHYSDAIAMMSLAGNAPAAVAELGRLADELWHLAGDTALDSSWYAKRAALAGVYAASEVFMSQDGSAGLVESEQFLSRRLDEMHSAGRSAGAAGEWLGFTASASVNVLRSWGVRI